MNWTEKKLDRVRNLLAKGLPRHEVALKIGVSEAALTGAIRRHGLTVPKPVDPIERRNEARSVTRLKHEHASLADEVERLREVLNMRKAFADNPLKPIKRVELKSGKREATAVALLSDLHVEERVLAGDTPLGNVYNLSIAETRLARAFASIDWLIDLYRDDWTITNVLLWFGGDMMSGQIHEENLETSDGTPIETLLWLRPRLVEGVKRLREKDLQVTLPCSFGNHGRDTKQCRFAKGAGHSYEWGMYQELCQDFRDDPGVQVLADPSEHQYVTAYDFDLHFHHGHRVNYGGGVGGITIPINKAVSQWDKVRRCQYHHFGHFHDYIDIGNVMVNGSLIGYNSYAMGIKATPQDPMQAFYLLDSKRGKTAKHGLWVSE